MAMTMRNLRSNTRSSASKQPTSVAAEAAPSTSGGVVVSDDAETEKQEPVVDADAITADAEIKDASTDEPTAMIHSSNTSLPLNRKDVTKNSNKSIGKTGPGNELTHLIPGYTAPMRLESNLTLPAQRHSSGSIGGGGGGIAHHANTLSELRQRASRAEVARYNPTITNMKQKQLSTTTTSFLSTGVQKSTPTTTSFLTSASYRKTPSKIHDPTAGSGWFHMQPTPMTQQLKTDLSLIRNRNYLDPKKFYKSADSFDGKILQVGTVIEGSSEYYSSRMTKKERRLNITEELMADDSVRQYAKRKYLDIQNERDRSSSSKKGGKQMKGRKGGRR